MHRTSRHLVALATTALALASAVGFFGGAWWVFDLFAHFRLQLGLALLASLLSAVGLRQRRVALLAAVFALANFGVVSPQLVHLPTADAQGAGSLRLVHANVNYYNRRFETAVDFLEEADPDVLVIVEANEAWMAALEPLETRLPYVRFENQGRFGVAVMSRYPMVAEAISFTRRNPTMVAEIETPAGGLRIIGTHARSPASARRSRLRDAQLEAIAAYVRDAPRPTVLVGDLNTTPWGHAFRSLVEESRLRDSSRGAGFQWSWPADFWPLAIPIDHALVSRDIDLLGRRMGPRIGSDHLPLILDLQMGSNRRADGGGPP